MGLDIPDDEIEALADVLLPGVIKFFSSDEWRAELEAWKKEQEVLAKRRRAKMGLLECASGASVWRGYDYYNQKKVKNLTETASGVFTADVIGTASEPYVVEIDVAHPRKSTCNCPHADGKRIVASIWWQLILPHIPKRQLDFTESI